MSLTYETEARKVITVPVILRFYLPGWATYQDGLECQFEVILRRRTKRCPEELDSYATESVIALKRLPDSILRQRTQGRWGQLAMALTSTLQDTLKAEICGMTSKMAKDSYQ